MASDCDVCRGAHCEAIEQSASDDKRYGLEFLKRVTITINTNVKLNRLLSPSLPVMQPRRGGFRFPPPPPRRVMLCVRRHRGARYWPLCT